ncbi:MAG: hypothetical protein ABJA98_33090 [Acidobacteriota bacterium]
MYPGETHFFSSLLYRQPTEIPEDDQVGEPLIDRRELFESGVEVQEFHVPWLRGLDRIRQGHSPFGAAAFTGGPHACMVHQHPTHQARGDRKKMGAVLPAHPPQGDEAHVSLVHERRRDQ